MSAVRSLAKGDSFSDRARIWRCLFRVGMCALVLGVAGCAPSRRAIALPRPLVLSVDDCGWQKGASLAASGGPWRLGTRDATMEDYYRLARIARAAGTRLLTAWVMSELDRGNICARPEYNMPAAPSDMTEVGLSWDNSANVNDDNLLLMEFLRQESAWLEFALHGVRHEHWVHGKRTRAEFGRRDGRGWSVEDNTTHLRCFADLLRQYYPAEVNPFPASFVPPNHGYRLQDEDPISTGAALHEFGVRFVQLPGPMRVDHGVLVLSRDTHASPPYNSIGQLPGQVPDDAAFVMTHLPNFFASEADWIAWFRSVDERMDRVLPKSTAQAASQEIYATYTQLEEDKDSAVFDTTGIPDEFYDLSVLGPLVLKIDLATASILSVTIDNGAQVVATYPDGHGHVVVAIADPAEPLGRLRRSLYHLRVDRGRDQPGDYVLLDGTYQVFGLRHEQDETDVALEMYGGQEVDVVIPDGTPTSVATDNPHLDIGAWTWSADQHMLRVPISATNMQGERGTLQIMFNHAGAS